VYYNLGNALRGKGDLEGALGEAIVLQQNFRKTSARLYVEKQQGKITDELRDWAVDKMQVLIQVLQPELDKAKES